MRTLAAIGALLLTLLALACEDPYTQNDLELLVASRVLFMCECVYVMNQDEAYCLEYSNPEPRISSVSVDTERRVVEAQALLMWSDRAHWVAERFGCIFD